MPRQQARAKGWLVAALRSAITQDENLKVRAVGVGANTFDTDRSPRVELRAVRGSILRNAGLNDRKDLKGVREEGGRQSEQRQV